MLHFIGIQKDESEIRKILEKMDPNNINNITYSQCAAAFSIVKKMI